MSHEAKTIPRVTFSTDFWHLYSGISILTSLFKKNLLLAFAVSFCRIEI